MSVTPIEAAKTAWELRGHYDAAMEHMGALASELCLLRHGRTVEDRAQIMLAFLALSEDPISSCVPKDELPPAWAQPRPEESSSLLLLASDVRSELDRLHSDVVAEAER